MVVKPLFPPGEKKGVNDTLELTTPTPAAPPSPLWRLSDTHSPLGGEEAGETAMAVPLPPIAGGSNKKEGGGGGGPITVIIITKYNIKQSVRGRGGRDPPIRPHARNGELC